MANLVTGESLSRESSEARKLLEEYIARHNDGVRTRDFRAMLDLFSDSAEMHFERFSVGPFIGKNALAQAFAASPPDDQLVLLDAKFAAAIAYATYGWTKRPTVISGKLNLHVRSGRIVKIVIL